MRVRLSSQWLPLVLWVSQSFFFLRASSSARVAGNFFCPENHEQVFKKVPVISIESDEYYIPALYFIPSLM